MIVSKSTCGLCKPTKRFKKNNTKLESVIKRVLLEDELTVNLIKVIPNFLIEPDGQTAEKSVEGEVVEEEKKSE